MGWVWTGIGVLGLVLPAVCFATAVPVYSNAPRRLQNRLLALTLWLFGLATLAGAIALRSATETGDHWGYGTSRTAGVLVLAYAIVRGQLLGVDVKVRWTLSKSTVAAAFVAAFFIASEGAQILFGQENPYVGVAAAGMLVFAIAPLQRAAERLAERAVPVAEAPGTVLGAVATRGAESYRRAVRLALRDRTLSHDEEVELATVAHNLGLTAPEATRIRLEVERELVPPAERGVGA